MWRRCAGVIRTFPYGIRKYLSRRQGEGMRRFAEGRAAVLIGAVIFPNRGRPRDGERALFQSERARPPLIDKNVIYRRIHSVHPR
jgi:hypothetical protein